jgi:hypothetical protein
MQAGGHALQESGVIKDEAYRIAHNAQFSRALIGLFARSGEEIALRLPFLSGHHRLPSFRPGG